MTRLNRPTPTLNEPRASASGLTEAPTHAPTRQDAFQASLDFFLTPLRKLLADPQITEIMVNGHDQVYFEKQGRIQRADTRFDAESDVEAAANNIAQFVGQPLSPDRPILDGRLPDGSRICIVLAPIAANGTQINIRRFAPFAASPQFLLDNNSLTPMAMEFLLLNVKAYRNTIISGGAGSGKTTLLNVLSTAFDPDERIVIIEETRELQIPRPHVVQLEARLPDAHGRGQVTVRELFVTSLRMRPDRIVVGEVRRGEALDMIQAMTSGHRGSLTSLHASSPADACHRLETMALMTDIALPLMALRRQVASAIDLLVQTDRLPDGRRLVTHISQVRFDETSQHYVISDIFSMQVVDGKRMLSWTGNRPELADEIAMDALRDEIKLTAPMFQGSAT